MNGFLASPRTVAALGDDSRTKIFAFSPTADQWDLAEILELCGLVETYRSLVPQPRIIPIIPETVLHKGGDIEAITQLLCTADVIVCSDKDQVSGEAKNIGLVPVS